MDETLILDGLRQSVVDCDEQKAVDLARTALEAGMDPLATIERGLAAGLRVVGDAFDRGDAFLPDLVMAGQTMKSASAILEERLKELPVSSRGEIRTAVIGTVRNDIHDIGKSLVGLMLFCAGWKVIDLGTSVSAERFVEAVEANNARLVGLSSLLTTTAPEMGKVIAALREKGIRSQVKVIVGGGGISEEFATRIGVDAYGVDASDGARKAKALFPAVEGGQGRDH